MLIGKIVLGIEIRHRHVVAAMAAVFALGVVLAWTLLPAAGLRWGLVRALRDLGMVEVSVSDADLSLFGGRVMVRQMVARPPTGAALGVRDFALRFRWTPLLNKRVVVDRIALEGVEVDIRRAKSGGGFVINGLPLAVAAAPPPGAEPAGKGQDWGIDVASLELTGSRLLLADGDSRAEIAVERLVVENLHSRDPAVPVTFLLRGSLNGAAVDLAGSVTPFAADPAFTLTAALRRFDLAGLRAAVAPMGLEGLGGSADLDLSLTGTLKPSGPAVAVSARLAAERLALAAPVTVAADRLGLHLRHLRWEGGRLDLAAALDLAAVVVKAEGNSAAATSVKLDAASLGWDGRRLGWQGGLDVAGAHVVAAGIDASPEAASWNGRVDLDTGGGHPAGRAEGKLDLGALRLVQGEFVAGHRHAAAEGWVEFGGGGVSPATAKLRLLAEGLTLREPAKGQDWLALDRLDGTDVTLAADGAVSAGRIAADGLAALRRDGKAGFPWRVEAKSVRLDRPMRDAEGDLSAGELRVDGLTARVTHTRDGLLGLPKPAKPAPGAKEAEPPAIELARLSVAGDSRILFEDRTLAEMVRLEARPVEMTLSDLDSDRPDRDSPFQLRAEIGESTITFGGAVRPFADDVTGRVDGRIAAFELPPLSPFLADALGIHLYTGHFDGTLKAAASAGKLDGKLDLVLSSLAIAPPDPNAPVAKKVEMPVETVLDLLRDGDGRIQLSLPVRGRLDNPDFDISDAVAQAVGGALRSTVLTTLKVAFPVAALISLAMDANDQSRLALAPLAFAPGADTLGDDHRKILAGIGELMKGRPGLKLTLCGKATDADWPMVAQRRRIEEKPLLSKLERLVGMQRKAEDFGPSDRDALVELADRRAGAAKEYLADQAGIDPGRLFACRAEVDSADKEARVELLL